MTVDPFQLDTPVDSCCAGLSADVLPATSVPQNVMILGDFNADGSYVSNKKMKNIRIRSDKNFHWLIGDDVDTTASNRNDHTYDR